MIKLQLNLPDGFQAYQHGSNFDERIGLVWLYDHVNSIRAILRWTDNYTEEDIEEIFSEELVESIEIIYAYMNYHRSMTQINPNE